MQIQSAISTDYAALLDGAALLARPAAGVLILSDGDRADFLQRMTTNNISALKPGQSAVTVLTSPTARIVQVFTVLCREDVLWLLPAPGETAALARHLRGQIFFMDKVSVNDASAAWARLRLMGPAAESTIRQLGLAPTTNDDGAWAEHDGVVAVRQQLYDLPGFEVMAPADRLQVTVDTLTRAGAHLLADDEAYQARRIELGRPAPGQELTGDYSPLEAGLSWACAENKGCYTGQEIIARQITYDKVTKGLVGLRTTALSAIGAAVTVGGQTVGTVTSAAFSPTLEAPVALAIIKRPHNTPGVQVEVGGHSAEIMSLPFRS